MSRQDISRPFALAIGTFPLHSRTGVPLKDIRVGVLVKNYVADGRTANDQRLVPVFLSLVCYFTITHMRVHLPVHSIKNSIHVLSLLRLNNDSPPLQSTEVGNEIHWGSAAPQGTHSPHSSSHVVLEDDQKKHRDAQSDKEHVDHVPPHEPHKCGSFPEMSLSEQPYHSQHSGIRLVELNSPFHSIFDGLNE